MLEREDLRQVRSVIKDVLREEHLDKLPDLFGREHHKHRGTHDLVFSQLIDTPDYIDKRQYITIVNEGEDGIAFVGLLGTDHQIVVTKNPDNITLSADSQFFIYSDTEQPIIRVSNLSEEERDPVYQYGLGPDDEIGFTHGVDDSDEDAWLLCYGDVLSSVVIPADPGNLVISYDGRLGIPDYKNASVHRLKTHSSAGSLAYVSEISLAQGSGDDQAGNAIQDICSDGTYYYITDRANHRIKKHRISDGLFVWAVGGPSSGTGNDDFNSPWGICTDGTYLYVVDRVNLRIKKHLCSTGAYVAKVGSYGTGANGFLDPFAICTDGVHLYITQNGGWPGRIEKYTLGLIYVGQLDDDGYVDSATLTGICAQGPFLYLVNSNYADGSSTFCIYRYTVGLTYSSRYGKSGTADSGEFNSPDGIDSDSTHLFITETGVPQIKKIKISIFSFVSKIGSSGQGDDQFAALTGICIGKTFSYVNGTVASGPILKAGADGSYCDSYPLFRARDGFQLMEDGTVGATKYVGLYAPASISASYPLTFPGAGPSAAGHFAVDASGNITWGQAVLATASPTFAGLTIGSLSGILKGTAGVVSAITDNSANWDTAYGWGDHSLEGYLKTLALDGLSDVEAPSPNDGDVLTWESASSSWKPKAP